MISVATTILATWFNLLIPKIFQATVDSLLGSTEINSANTVGRMFLYLGGREQLRGNLFIVAALIIAVALLSAVFTYISRSSMITWSESILKKLRDKLFSTIQKSAYSWLAQNSTGELIQRCTGDVDIIRGFLNAQVMEIFRTFFMVAISLYFMFSENIKLSLVSVVFFPVLIAGSAVFYKKISQRFAKADQAEGVLSQIAQENLTGVRVVKAFGRESYEVENFNKQLDVFSNLWIDLGFMMGSYWGLGDFITGLQIATITVYGSFLAVNGQISLGNFIAFVMYNTALIWPVRSMGRILSESSKAAVSVERINYILDAPQEQQPQNPVCPNMAEDIEFKNVSFAYGGAKPLLKNINFKIKAGTTVGVLGSTGSGKSTLVHLLTGLYELDEGCGEVEIGGVNIKDIPKAYLRKNVSIVLQEPFLFSKTLEENIKIASPQLGLEDIRLAAQVAELDHAIMQFPKGYSTLVGERGVTLSGGQKQRTAIARSLVTGAPIMIFDDSLSAVDAQTDAKIRASLKNAAAGTTTIIISHRINSLMHADQIIVLDNGNISDIGTHSELCARAGIYRNIYEIQHGNIS